MHALGIECLQAYFVWLQNLASEIELSNLGIGALA